jgi:hypothetical protein
MFNVQCSMLNVRRPFNIQHSTLNIQHFRILAVAVCVFTTATLFANDLSVDKRTVLTNDTVTIVVSLEDAFASLDDVDIPVKNLEIDRPPSMSSGFSWINGTAVRRKVLRFTGHPVAPGQAVIGPIRIDAPGGQRDTLDAISINVVQDKASQSNDAAAILRELSATGREPFFIVADIDRTSAYVGEEIIVTWMLYNGASVQQWQIARVPKLEDFWTEELDVRDEVPSRAMVDGVVLQALPIRRVAIFPLRSGTLNIGSMEIAGAVMRRIDAGPFGLFEGSLVEVHYPSAEIALDVKPLPPGPPVDVVGDVALTTWQPRQKNGGPVVVEAALSGRANLRGAAAPRWEKQPDADVQVEDAGLSVDRTHDAAVMRRRWRYLLSPRQAGPLTIPPLLANTFVPSTATRMTLRSNGVTINVQTAPAVVDAPRAPLRSVANSEGLRWPLIIAIAAVLLFAVIALVGGRKSATGRARAIVAGRTPAEVRAAVHELLMKRDVDPDQLLRESSERGDAYRAVRSLTDAIETDRIDETSGRALLKERVGELLEVIG